MLFWKMWVKIEKPAILAWLIREASNLEVKFDLKRGFNNYIQLWMTFVFCCTCNYGKKKWKTEILKKFATLHSCNFRKLFVPYLNFLEIADLSPYWVFQIFLFWKKTSVKRIFLKIFQTAFISHLVVVNLIPGTFWDIPVNFSKNINSQLWASYE